MAILNYTLDFHRQNSNKNKRDYNLCKRYATNSRYFVTTVIIFYVIVAQIYQSPKYYKGLTTGKIEPSIGAYVPFVEDMDGGLEIIQAYNITMGVILSIVMGIFDAVVYLMSGNLTIIPTIIKREINDLKTTLEMSKPSLRELRTKLHGIILMNKMYNR